MTAVARYIADRRAEQAALLADEIGDYAREVDQHRAHNSGPADTAYARHHADALARLDDGIPEPGDAELVDRYDERVLGPAWLAFQATVDDQARAAADVGWTAP